MNIIDSVYKYIQTGRSWYDREEKDIEKIVVHHSAIKMDKRLSDETLLDQIMRVHVGHDWPGLSYHYVICPNGHIHKCNEHTDITWHDTINNDSLGILVCGYFHPDVNDEPTKEQLISLKELLDWLCTENPQFPADEEDVVGHRDRSATACLPLDTTEILTKEGFINLSDVGNSQDLAQFDIKTKKITFTKPIDIVDPFMSEVLCNKYVEQTPDHLGLRFTSKGNLIKEKWGDMAKITQVTIPVSGNYSSKGIKLTDGELKYLVAVQADGHYSKDNRTKRVKNGKEYNSTPYEIGVQFHMKKERKIERLLELLNSLHADYYIRDIKLTGAKKITVRDNSKYNREWCEKYLNNKHFSTMFLQMGREQADIFLNELRYWDGKSTVDYINYSSKYKDNIDIVQALAVMNGYRSKSKKRKRVYEISVVKTDKQGIPNKFKKRNTLVGCVEVERGNIVVRQNGFVFLTGNCPGDILNKYVMEYRENKGSVSWVDEEATSECEAKLSDMRDSRNKWREDCKNIQKQLEVAIEISKDMEGKYNTEVSKYQNAIKAWEIDAKNLKTVTEDLVVLTQEIIDLKDRKYTVKQSLTFLKQAIKNILKRGESND